MSSALVDQVGGIGQELVGGRACGRQQIELQRQLVHRRDGVRPLVQQALVGGGHVEQVGDGQDRDRPGDLLQHVEPVPVVESVQDRVDGRLDAGAQLLDPAGGEGLGDQPRTRVWTGGSTKSSECSDSRCIEGGAPAANSSLHGDGVATPKRRSRRTRSMSA